MKNKHVFYKFSNETYIETNKHGIRISKNTYYSKSAIENNAAKLGRLLNINIIVNYI